MPFLRMHTYIPFSALPCLHVLFVKYLRALLIIRVCFSLELSFFLFLSYVLMHLFSLCSPFSSHPVCILDSSTCTNFLNVRIFLFVVYSLFGINLVDVYLMNGDSYLRTLVTPPALFAA